MGRKTLVGHEQVAKSVRGLIAAISNKMISNEAGGSRKVIVYQQ